jgi:antitoxin StbD
MVGRILHAGWVSILDEADGELVLPTSVARNQLTKIVAGYRARGAAGPVLFGSQRKPEAAVVPYELIRLLDPIIEDLVIAARVQERLAEDTGERTSHDDVVATMGWNPDGSDASSPRRKARKPSNR